jgi:hypothetical protein
LDFKISKGVKGYEMEIKWKLFKRKSTGMDNRLKKA